MQALSKLLGLASTIAVVVNVHAKYQADPSPQNLASLRHFVGKLHSLVNDPHF